MPPRRLGASSRWPPRCGDMGARLKHLAGLDQPAALPCRRVRDRIRDRGRKCRDSRMTASCTPAFSARSAQPCSGGEPGHGRSTRGGRPCLSLTHSPRVHRITPTGGRDSRSDSKHRIRGRAHRRRRQQRIAARIGCDRHHREGLVPRTRASRSYGDWVAAFIDERLQDPPPQLAEPSSPRVVPPAKFSLVAGAHGR